MKRLLTALVIAGGLSLTGGAVASADCHDDAVDATDFFVDGELDISAYLAAVEAALAACAPTAPGVGLPATGANTSALLPIALGLTAVGGAAVVSTGVRRRSTNR
jgi:LPXTG-motif cell wall-anchored protein